MNADKLTNLAERLQAAAREHRIDGRRVTAFLLEEAARELTGAAHERVNAAAFCAHVAEQFADRPPGPTQRISNMVATIIAGMGNAILGGVHMVDPKRWPRSKQCSECGHRGAHDIDCSHASDFPEVDL